MNAIKPILPVILVILFCGCGNDWLNLEPETKVPTDETLLTLKDARYAMNGIYNTMQNAGYYGATMMYYADLKGGDFMSKKSSDRGNGYYRFSHSANSSPAELWSYPYTVTRFANNVLEKIDNLMGEDEKECKDIKAQALTARALALFDMTRVFGYPYTKDGGASLGVPVVRQPVPTDYKPRRDSVRTCYRYILKDLTDALPLFKGQSFDEEEDEQEASVTGRLNRWAAWTLLCRVYLYKGDYQAALEEAKKLIEEAEQAGYRLWTNSEYSGGWSGVNNAELFFEIVNTNISGPDKESLGYLYWRKGYKAIIGSDDFYEFMKKDSKDIRYKLIERKSETVKNEDGTENKIYYYYWNKYPGEAGEDPRMANIRIFRLSEVYLIAAEAAAHLRINEDAVTYLRPLVERGNPAKTVSDDEIVTVDRVLDERRKELAGEGHRMCEMRRNGKTITRTPRDMVSVSSASKSFNWDYYKVAMPIPRSEMDCNENLAEQQNPGY